MVVIPLQSGSNGNSIYVETDGVKLLFDAGISGRQAELRLAAYGRDIRRIDGVLISHDHADHVCCLGVYSRRYGLPVYVTAKTLRAAADRYCLGRLKDVRSFQAGGPITFGHVRVETIRTPHDGVDGVAFVLDDGERRLGILTDLGHVFDGLARLVGTLDAVVLESNYDPDMLANGPYPEFLKRRIAGGGGHISNVEAAELLHRAAGTRMQWACLAHLSEQNNHPDLALTTHRQLLQERFPIHVAGRYEPAGVFSV